MSTFLILLSIAIILISFVLQRIRKNFKYWQNLQIPVDEPNWIVGSLSGAFTEFSFAELLQNYYRKYKESGGPFAGFYWFARPSVFVYDLELIKTILIKDFSKFTDRGFFYNEKDDPLTGNLFNLEGSIWRNMRNKLSPNFTSGKIKLMFSLVQGTCKHLMDVIEQGIEKSQSIEITDLLARFSMDVIGTCAFGIECNSLKNQTDEFRLMARKSLLEQRYGVLGNAFRLSFPQLARRLGLKETVADVEKFFMDTVRDTVEYREKHNIQRNDFLGMLIDMKNQKDIKTDMSLSMEELAAQAFLFITAGFDTSSATLGFALYELASNQEIQDKLRAEIQEVLQQNDKQFTYDCIKQMKYMEQIISETLRLYTIAPLVNRQALEDYPIPDHPRYVIRKGMPITIPIAAIHRDEEYYPHANTFNPENFSAEAVAERDPMMYMPFGDGPRNCIGLRFAKMQIIVCLTMLLQKYRFELCSETQVPLQFDKKSFFIAAEKGIYLKVIKL